MSYKFRLVFQNYKRLHIHTYTYAHMILDNVICTFYAYFQLNNWTLLICSLLQNAFIISVRYQINTAVDREVARERVISFFQRFELTKPLRSTRGRDRINSSERLTIILLIELNTCTCGGLCKRSFMLIVRTFSVDKLERIQSRGKTSETKSIYCFEDYALMGFASKTKHVVSPYIYFANG